MTTFIPGHDIDITPWRGRPLDQFQNIDVDVEDVTVATIQIAVVESSDPAYLPDRVALTIDPDAIHSIMIGDDYYVYDGGKNTLILTDVESGEPMSHGGTRALISNEQAIDWAGRDVDLDALAEAIPHSSIPDAISTIVANLASHEEQCA